MESFLNAILSFCLPISSQKKAAILLAALIIYLCKIYLYLYESDRTCEIKNQFHL